MMLAKQKNIYFIVFLVSELMISSSSWAALNAYLTIKGQNGNIEGDVILEGREGTIEVVGFNHELILSDRTSGLHTGGRQHKPLTIIKAIDKSSPVLITYMIQNKNIPEVILRFYRRDTTTGVEVQYYTIKLTNAKVSSNKTLMLNNKFSDYTNQEVMEEISFTYQKIEWTIEDGGITAEDDWTSVN